MQADVLKSTTADKIIGSLKRMFLAHGLPVSIKSDNGPQFISQDFKEFVKEECIDHSTVTPLWPQANGEIERPNRSLLKRIIDRTDREEELEGGNCHVHDVVQNNTTQHNWDEPC